mgnify:FL=1
MAESYSVKAVLSAVDSNFSSVFGKVSGIADKFKSSTSSLTDTIKKTAVGIDIFKAVGNAVSTMAAHMDDAVSRYDTMNSFPKTMKNLGISAKDSKSAISTLSRELTGLPMTLDDAASGVTRFTSKNNDIKKSTKYFLALNNAIVAGGQSTEIQSSALEQLSQAYSKGKMDMTEWQSLQMAMPAQLNQVAKAMNMSTDALGTGLRDGSISMDEFMDTMVQLNEKGVDGFASFEEQARSATGGIRTAFTNMGTAVERGMSNCISAIDTVLVDNGLPTIAQIAIKVSGVIDTAFTKIARTIEKASPYFGVIKEAAVEVGKAFGKAFSAIGKELSRLNGSFGSTKNIENFGGAIDTAAGALKTFAGFLENHADVIANVIDHLPQLLGAYLAFKAVKKVAPGVMTFGRAISSLAGKGISGLAGKLFQTSKGQEAVGKTSKATSKQILTSAKAFMMLGAGIMLISAGFYLLTQAAVTLSESGGLAIGIFAGMALAVTALSLGLMAMLTNIQSTPKQMETLGNSFLKVAAGVAVMVGSLAALALALTPLASLGTTAVPPLLAFGVVVGGLAAVFATFGQALKTNMAGIAVFAASVSLLAAAMAPIASTGTEGAAAMAAFGVVVGGLVAVFATFGSGLNAAIPGMLALGAAAVLVGEGLNLASGFIKEVTPLVEELGNTFTKVSDGVAKVVDAISGGFSKVLDSIAGIIKSIGTSAKNAGIGFKSVASGIKTISGLSIGSIVKSLGAVGKGLHTISTKGKDLPTVADGMSTLVAALIMATTNILLFNAGMQTLSTMLTTLPTNINMLKASFANFTITPPNVEPLVTALTKIKTSSQGLVTAFAGLGVAAMMASAQVGASSGGILVLSAVMISASSGASAMASRLKSAKSGLQAISSGANKAKSSLTGLQSSFRTTTSGLGTIGTKATTSMNQLTTAFKNAAKQAKTAGKQIGNDFVKTMQAGLKKAPSAASKAVSSVVTKLRAGRGKVYSAGAYISKGFAQGMLSCMGTIESAARRMAAAADKAVRAKAKIHSPSKVSTKLGGYWGTGFVNGIMDKAQEVKRASEELISIPALSMPKVSFAYAGEMSADYDYCHNRVYVIEVPVEIEGREVARASAKYTKEELDKMQAREDRRHGRR